MKLTDKQKDFILNNIDILDNFQLQEIIEELIDNMTKEYATKLIEQMVEELNDIGNYLNIGDTF